MKTVITIILFSFINIVSAENELINFQCDLQYEYSSGFFLKGVMDGLFDTSQKTKTFIYNKSIKKLTRPSGELQECYSTDSQLVCSNKRGDKKNGQVDTIIINRASLDITFSMEVYESTKKTENFWVEKGQCIMFNKNQF